MECLKRHVFSSRTKETLESLSVEEPNAKLYKKILKNWDAIAKPLDGLGRFESVTAQIGAILGEEEIDLSKKAVILMCADNGIVEEGISQCGQEVTAAVVKQMAKGASAVGKMAAVAGADTVPVDIGIHSEEQIAGVRNLKIRKGTRNFRIEPAMTQEETAEAIFTGIDIVQDCRAKGYRILAAGEMGIGNTTTSSAVAAALLKCKADAVTGRGAGLSDRKLEQKRRVITEAVEKYQLYHADAFRVLQTVGGLDIAGLTGVCIGGALFGIPVVLDGVISLAAALLAERMAPGTVQYLIPSHKGKEPAAEMLAKELGLSPVIDGQMALGEGTGAVMMFPLLDMALSVYHGRNLFSDIEVEQYKRY